MSLRELRGFLIVFIVTNDLVCGEVGGFHGLIFPMATYLQILNISSMLEKVIGVSPHSCHYMSYMIYRKVFW